jgi:hypothetical protein
MIFVMTTSDPSVEAVTRIKVPGRSTEDQPCLAFASIDLGQFFQRVRGIDDESHRIVHIDDVPRGSKVPSNFLIFTSGQQILDSLADPEGYEYESLIRSYDSYAR